VKCGIFHREVGLKHQATQCCVTGHATRTKREEAKAQSDAKTIVFKIGDRLIETVQSIKYLGRILEENDGDLPAVEGNLRRAG
jgi:hypothetical protein